MSDRKSECCGAEIRTVVAEVDGNEANDVLVDICSKCRKTVKRHKPVNVNEEE